MIISVAQQMDSNIVRDRFPLSESSAPRNDINAVKSTSRILDVKVVL